MQSTLHCTRLHALPHRVALERVGLAAEVQQVAHSAAVPRHQAAQVGAALAADVGNHLERLWQGRGAF